MGGSKETKELTTVSFLTSPGAQVLLSICQSSLCVWLCDVQGCSGKFKDRGGVGLLHLGRNHKSPTLLFSALLMW